MAAALLGGGAVAVHLSAWGVAVEVLAVVVVLVAVVLIVPAVYLLLCAVILAEQRRLHGQQSDRLTAKTLADARDVTPTRPTLRRRPRAVPGIPEVGGPRWRDPPEHGRQSAH